MYSWFPIYFPIEVLLFFILRPHLLDKKIIKLLCNLVDLTMRRRFGMSGLINYITKMY